MPSIKTKDNIVIQGIPQEVMENEALLKQTVASLRSSSGEGTYNFQDVAKAQAKPEGTGSSLAGTPEQQAQITPPDPSTTAGGIGGAMLREAGGPLAATALGAGLGSIVPGVGTVLGAGVGLAGYGITELLSPAIAKLVNNLGGNAMDLKEAEAEIYGALNVPEADTDAERLVGAGTRGAVEAGKMLAGGSILQAGKTALGTGNLAQGVGKVLAEQPLKQVVGGALSGVGAEGGMQIAEKADMGPVGSVLLPLGLGILGDVAGTGLVSAAEKVNNLLVAKGMDLPDAAAEAIRLSQGRGELFLSDLDPKTSGAEAGRSFRETVSGGTQDLRLDRNIQRRNLVYDTMDDFGVVEGDYYNRDIVDDFLGKRGDLLTKWKGAKDEVIDRLSHGGMDVGDSLAPEDAVDITKTLDLIGSKRAELAALGDDSLQPLINTLTNWEGALDNKNLKQIEFLRKRLRNTFEDPNLAPLKKDGDALAKSVYNSLNEEMGEYITKNGAEGDFAQWKTANAALADMMGDFEVGALSNLIKKGDTDPSVINRFLQSNDKEMVQNLYDGLTPQGRDRARSAIMADMVKKSTDLGDLSPNQFARQISDQSDAHKVFFREEDGAQLEGLRKWLEITKRDEFPAGSPGRPGAGVPGGQYALARGLWADPKIGIPVALAGKLGAGKFSKFLEQGEVRDLLIKYAEIPTDKIATAGQEMAKRLGEIYRGFMASEETPSRVSGRTRGIGEK